MPASFPITRALLSVSNKDGIIPFAKQLSEYGIEIISTGGTSKVLSQAGIPVTSVDALTGFPEMLDGRVKTLHPGHPRRSFRYTRRTIACRFDGRT